MGTTMSDHSASDGSTSAAHHLARLAPDAGIFDLGRLEPPPMGWSLAIVPAVVAWLGSVAFVGQFRSSQVTREMAAVVPLGALFWACVGASCVGVLVAVAFRRRSLGVLWATVLGYMLGHVVFSALPLRQMIDWSIPFQDSIDGVGFAIHRLLYGACVASGGGIGMLIASRLLGSRPIMHLGVGSWGTLGRGFTHKSRPETYRRAMVGFVVFAVILWIMGQMSVELRPIRSGTLWGLVPAIVLAAVVNALIEELIYRGVLQPAFVHASGIARGLWIQGMMFGMLHWGMSVGVLAALPTSLLIGLGSVFWGKAAVDTRGLSWVVVAHAMVDVAIMCAYFVPRR
jgi:membrane protease YdiL (CAAX protease family)